MYVAGGTIGTLVTAWEGTEQQRKWVTDKIGEGLRSVGQYSQDRVEQVQGFFSEKVLEKKNPGRPTPENTGGEFEPPKKGNKTAKVEEGPMAGREGWLDKDGNIWVPTNGKAAHGHNKDTADHYDVQDKKGRGHRNVYPGGHVRSDIDGIDPNQPSVAVADPLRRGIEDKVPALLAQHNISATPQQVQNIVDNVRNDVLANKQTTVDQLLLVEGTNGKSNIIAMSATANEFSPRTATALETAMHTPAKDSHQAPQASPPSDNQIAQTLAPRSLT